ncbi:MAG: ATP-binding cassette domain-containing protein, partial [Clostridia bacterium]|nr:ATP-binding cassette domain-containing protein [Clostridia bacterium]
MLYEKMVAIDIKDVSFEYDKEVVFDNASASFEKGKIVCITGASGAGKSTLFRLLLRVFTHQQGEIVARCQEENVLIDESTRGLFAYVPQGNFLFSGSIYENLTFYADKDVADDEVKNALESANATFVYDLPSGLTTPLLEHGGGLSEGQLQRLAIARAILSDRPVLLLDEATSALDEETEKCVLENIKGMQNKTCLIVTHRPAALSIADSVLKVENGRLITIR